MDFNEFQCESAEIDGFLLFYKVIHGCKGGFEGIQLIFNEFQWESAEIDGFHLFYK